MIFSTICDLGPRRIGAVAPLLILLISSAAAAQTSKRDTAAAEALFKAGRVLVEAGDYAAGCPKFDASLALNPSASTMLNIAKCHEHEGKLATAWSDYNESLVLNKHETKGAERQRRLEDFAKDGIAALEPRIPKLRIIVRNPPPDLRVTRGGNEIPIAALGEALPVDPGSHEISVRAPGYEAKTYPVVVEEGKTVSVEVAVGKKEQVSKEAPREQGDQAQAIPPKPAEEPHSGTPAWVWVSGGAGIVLAGASAFFLVDNRAAVSALDDNCQEGDKGTFCSPGYDFESDNARKNRGLALFLGLGGASVVALGAAVIGLVQTPSAKAPEASVAKTVAVPWLAPGTVGATLTSRF